MKRLFKTDNHWTGLIARLILGTVMLAHGMQKALGVAGGYGFEGTMNFFTTAAGLPWIVAFAIIALEFIGSIALLLGLATRFWAAGFIALMLSAIIMVHSSFGFYMNWEGAAKGEGFEFHLLAIGLGLVSLVNGGGRLSADYAMQHNK